MGVEGVPASGSVWRVPGMPWLLGSAMLWFAGFALLVPVAPLWVIRGGSNDLGAGLVTGIMMAGTVLAQLSMRRVLDGLGWRWTLVLGAGLLGLPALGHLATDRLGAVTALAALRGLGFGGVTVGGATAVASLVEPGRRGRALGALGLAIAAPQFILVPVAPWLADRAGFGLVFVLAVLPALAIPLAWPVARAVGDSDRAPADSSGRGTAAALWRVLAGPIAALVVITASGGAILTFMPHILASPALGFAGLLAFTGAAAVSRWGAGGVADRFGATVAIAPLLFIGALGLAAIGLRADSVHDTAGRVLVVSGLLLVGVAYGGLQNLTLTQAFAAAGEPARNSVSIAWNLSFDAGTGFGALVVGAIATATSYSVAFAVLALAAGFAGVGWAVPSLARRGLPGPVAVLASVVATATVVPVLAAAAAARLVIAAAGEQDRADARNRLGPRLRQQGGGRFLGVLAVLGHPGRDEAGHDRRGEGRSAPLRHAGEGPGLPREGGDLTGKRAGGERVDQVLAGRVHIHPAAVVTEVRTAAPVGPERPDGDQSRERGRPVRQRAFVVPGRSNADDALIPAQVFHPGFEGHQRKIAPGRRRDRHVENLGAVGEPLVELRDEIRFQRAARGIEDVPDHDLGAGGQAPDDTRDKRAVPAVRQDRAVGADRRVVVSRHSL
jgi:predicted MFS family arabinose efflux permease